MKLLLPIAAMICTAITTLTAVVFCMGMGANSTPAQIRELKLWMTGLSLLGLVGIVAGIVMVRTGQHGMAAVVAIAPTVIFALILFIALIK